jgi:peptide deformylase
MKTPPRGKNESLRFSTFAFIGDALLRLKAEEVTTFDDELRDFIDDLVPHHGTSATAPVWPRRRWGAACASSPSTPHFYTYQREEPAGVHQPAHCASATGVFVYEKGCLSLRVSTRGQAVAPDSHAGPDPDGKPFEVEAEEYDAVVLQARIRPPGRRAVYRPRGHPAPAALE